MRVEVSYFKAADLTVQLYCEDPGDYYTFRIFEDVDRGGPSRYLWAHFPLSQEGLAEAKKWVSETIANLKSEIEKWRKFELPPKEVITI